LLFGQEEETGNGFFRPGIRGFLVWQDPWFWLVSCFMLRRRTSYCLVGQSKTKGGQSTWLSSAVPELDPQMLGRITELPALLTHQTKHPWHHCPQMLKKLKMMVSSIFSIKPFCKNESAQWGIY
jgi:hypothetical protein